MVVGITPRERERGRGREREAKGITNRVSESLARGSRVSVEEIQVSAATPFGKSLNLRTTNAGSLKGSMHLPGQTIISSF